MHKLALVAVVALALAATAPAGAGGKASSKAPTLRSLQAQITTLKRQVKALQKRVKNTEDLALGTLAYTGCSVAVTADAMQGTWTRLDSHFGSPVFGAQTPLNDNGLCQPFSVVRAQNQPTASVFSALLALFRSSAAAIQERVTGFAEVGRAVLAQAQGS